MKPLLALAAFVALAVPAPAAAADSSLPTGNLLRNPGAEEAPGSRTYEAVPVPGWRRSPGFTAVAYLPNAVDLPSAADAARLGGGASFFAAGNGDRATATQTVDVRPYAAAVDAGTVRATLSALIGGSRAQEDHGTVEASFLAAGGRELGRLVIGPVTAAQRRHATRLLPRSGLARVPAGTRAIRVRMVAVRVHGAWNEALFDNLSLSLAEQPAPHAALALARRCAAGTVNASVRPTGSLRIASVAFAAGGRRVVDRAAPFAAPLRAAAGRMLVTATVTDGGGRETVLGRAVAGCRS
jgi:hypothetical protein